MTQPHSWITEITIVLKELGGHGTLNDIYQKVEEREEMDLTTAQNYKNTIRGVIYSNTSDGRDGRLDVNNDIFFSVNGPGEGHWGLRDEYNPTSETIDYTEDDIGFPEGKKILRTHVQRERSPELVQRAKQVFKDKHGSLHCEICEFDFSKKYGDIGRDYIEAHHTIPVSELSKNHKSKIEDLVMVCSNCHRMLHRQRPWLEKEDLEKLISRK